MKTNSRGTLKASRLAGAWLVAIVVTSVNDATAADRLVLMEKFSASWCPHCSSASQDIAQLIADNPADKFVTFDAFIDETSQYVTEWGVARGFEFYGVPQ